MNSNAIHYDLPSRVKRSAYRYRPAGLLSEPSAAPQQRRGGALRGAAVGAVIGEIADDDAGKGAAYGAAAGVIAQRRGNVNAQQDAAEQQQQSQQQIAQQQQALAGDQQQQMDAYYRAYGACLSGRGYTVN